MEITRTARLLGAVVAAGVLLAACGDGELGTTGRSGSDSGQALKYSQCMRENGVAKFPDPKDGHLILRAGPGTGIDPESAQFQAADKACHHLAPAGSSDEKGPSKKRQQEALATARCMRTHGVPDWPDPEFEGGGIKMSLPKGLRPDSPQVRKAQAACGDLLSDGGGSAP